MEAGRPDQEFHTVHVTVVLCGRELAWGGGMVVHMWHCSG